MFKCEGCNYFEVPKSQILSLVFGYITTVSLFFPYILFRWGKLLKQVKFVNFKIIHLTLSF